MIAYAALALLLGHPLLNRPVATAELVGPYFAVDAQINGKPARLIVDTGAGMNVLTPEAAKRLGIEGGTPVTARGVGSQGVAARIVTLDAFQLGSLSHQNPRAAVIPLPALLEVDGLVGHGFLNDFVATFDYAKPRLDFVRPEDFRPPKEAVAVPLRLRNNLPEVELKVGDETGWVKVDSGASDNLTLFKGFIDRSQIASRVSGLKPSLGSRGVGGAAAADRGTLKGLSLAGFALPELSVSLSKQTAGAFSDDGAIGNLGSGILRRFVVSLDYRSGKAYFSKGPLFDSPDLKNRLGAAFDFGPEGHRVIWIEPGSPAAKAGLAAGDRLLEVDGKAAGQWRALEIWEVFRRPAGTKVSLKFQTKDRESRTFDFVLADF